ncbi:hypothetical protein Cgig2_032112 [Carnegiea gigantea]|uniref:PGG domain-containing protein n=1 Tax=Carnegiea gigantea TaxID=171969 RepID=A0A9Q1KK93_9CARY|nr:hypothetical protein Cgig2_032112 [Carnegiea gigantea]
MATTFRRARGQVENKLRDLGGFLPLYKAALEGQWNEARKFLDDDPEAFRAKITIASETALHIAVGTGENIDFVEKLIRSMSPEDLALIDQNGETALTVAAVVGNVKAAKLLVNKNPDLSNISGKQGLPVLRAANYGQEEMVKYLLAVTRGDIEPSPFAGESGAELLIAIITEEFFDIALELIELYPEMAAVEVNGKGSTLAALAHKTDIFCSGSSSTHWQLFFNPVGFIKRTTKERLKHAKALELVKALCREICELDDATAFSLFQKPLHRAAQLGIPEIIEEIVHAFPPVIWSSGEENRNVFQLAVMNRRENVFGLIYQMTNYKHLVTRYIDPNGNNILHLAGQLPSLDRLNLVSGAALQVQCELQWFQEVKKFVPPSQKEAKNKDGKTPKMVFRDAHQKLMKDGAQWMKTTATSCTVAAALIATVAFAAVIHAPEGNNREDPVTLSAFGVFAVTDAVSLFSSVTAILMFLSILTSRYSQEDFLYALPRGLIFGLSMLFISILTMMAAFAAAIILVFGRVKAVILIPLGGLAVLPVSLFVILPLLYQITMSTYGGIFPKQQPRDTRTLH